MHDTSMSKEQIILEWGHPLYILDLEGRRIRQIRVPNSAFVMLRKIGHLIRRKNAVYGDALLVTLNDHRLDPIMHKLRMMLGNDLQGPEMCICNCPACKKKLARIEKKEERGYTNDPVASKKYTDKLVKEIKDKRVYA